MSKFTFNENDSPEKNIQQFFAHLTACDPEMAQALQANLHLIYPLPDAPQARSTARKHFNDQILLALQKLGDGHSAAT